MDTDYEFYQGVYCGDSIPPEEFPRLAMRASAQLDQYKRVYRVEGEEDAQRMAVCAMADALSCFETAQNTPQSTSIGSVSSSWSTVDSSPKAQSRELFRCAQTYLDIYRGVPNASAR